MIEMLEIKPWFFHVEPYEEESISHFLGRFKRANALTSSGLGKASGVGGSLSRWEKFRFNPRPSQQELESLTKVVGIDADRLAQMLPPMGKSMDLEPIKLCGACYAELPCHRIKWQLKVTRGCSRHGLRLLSECPKCGARFKIPALWLDGHCHRCFMNFAEMRDCQKVV